MISQCDQNCSGSSWIAATNTAEQFSWTEILRPEHLPTKAGTYLIYVYEESEFFVAEYLPNDAIFLAPLLVGYEMYVMSFNTMPTQACPGVFRVAWSELRKPDTPRADKDLAEITREITELKEDIAFAEQLEARMQNYPQNKIPWTECLNGVELPSDEDKTYLVYDYDEEFFATAIFFQKNTTDLGEELPAQFAYSAVRDGKLVEGNLWCDDLDTVCWYPLTGRPVTPHFDEIEDKLISFLPPRL